MQIAIDEENQDSEKIKRGEEKREETLVPRLDLDKESYEKTTNNIEIKSKEDKGNQGKISANFLDDTEDNPFSRAYVRFNAEKFLKNIINDFIYWEENGTEASLFKVAEIKNKINYYSKYLNKSDESSIFLNTINLLMDNNCWDKISEGQLKVLIHELKRFEDGVIDWEKLKVFSKQIDRIKISILTVNEEQKTE